MAPLKVIYSQSGVKHRRVRVQYLAIHITITLGLFPPMHALYLSETPQKVEAHILGWGCFSLIFWSLATKAKQSQLVYPIHSSAYLQQENKNVLLMCLNLEIYFSESLLVVQKWQLWSLSLHSSAMNVALLTDFCCHMAHMSHSRTPTELEYC